MCVYFIYHLWLVAWTTKQSTTLYDKLRHATTNYLNSMPTHYKQCRSSKQLEATAAVVFHLMVL